MSSAWIVLRDVLIVKMIGSANSARMDFSCSTVSARLIVLQDSGIIPSQRFSPVRPVTVVVLTALDQK